jgi:hypothetical protein
VAPGNYEILVLGYPYRLGFLTPLEYDSIECQFGWQNRLFREFDVIDSAIAWLSLLTTAQQSRPHKTGSMFLINPWASRHQDSRFINLC